MQAIKNLYEHLPAIRLDENLPFRRPLSLAESGSQDRKIALPTMEGINFERLRDIISLEAQGNYTMLYFTKKRKLLVCKTLRDMEKQIRSGSQFVRIHRSHTINLDHLQKYVKGKGGHVVMENHMTISVSAGKKPAFLDALKMYFG